MVSPENTTLPSCSFCSGLVEDEEEEEEGERNRQREGQPFRLEDTSSLSWKRRHWRNGSLGRTASRWFRESSTCKESKTERQTEREMEREIERGERERESAESTTLPCLRTPFSLSLSPTLLLLPPRSKLLFSSGYTTDSPLFLSLSLLHRLSRSLSIAPSFCSFFLALSSVSVWFPKTCSFDSLWSHYTMKKRLSRREVELRMRKNATEQMSIRDIERNS